MKDTDEAIEKIYSECLMRKTNEERLRMGCSMFDLAKAWVIASILQEQPDLSDQDLRQHLFLKFYGSDFDAQEKERILKALAMRPGSSASTPSAESH